MDGSAQLAEIIRIAVRRLSLTATESQESSAVVRELVMPSENYRYYCLDGTGRLHDAAWFHAESDADAIAQISAMHPDAKCEIWQGQRLVASISPQRLQA